jgi:hypothetical protein
MFALIKQKKACKIELFFIVFSDTRGQRKPEGTSVKDFTFRPAVLLDEKFLARCMVRNKLVLKLDARHALELFEMT